jgi:hypothetical protein
VATEKPAPVPTQLYAIEVHESKSDELYYVIAHPVRATNPAMAVWEALRVYSFRLKHWRLQAVPAETHFPKTEAA